MATFTLRGIKRERKDPDKPIPATEFRRLWAEHGADGMARLTGKPIRKIKERAVTLGLRPRRSVRNQDERPYGGRSTVAQHRAVSAVTHAVKTGRLTRPDICPRCGDAPGVDKRGHSLIQAHHAHGYAPADRLNIEWLCVKCHRATIPTKNRKLSADAVKLIRLGCFSDVTLGQVLGIDAGSVWVCRNGVQYKDVEPGRPSRAYVREFIENLLDMIMGKEE